MAIASKKSTDNVVEFPGIVSARKAAQFITRIWEDQPGDVFFMGAAEVGERPKFGAPFTRDEFDEIEAFIEDNSHLNLWWVVHGCKDTRRNGDDKARRKGSAVEPRWLYSDLDNVDPDNMLVEFTIIYETSPGSFVGLLKMDKPTSFETNKRLSYAHGADGGAWSRSKFLRVPFTINRKKTRKNPTVRLLRDNGPEYTAASLNKALGVWARVSDQGMSYIWTKPNPKKPHSDDTKSEKIFAAECRLVEEGFNDDEIVELLTDSHWNKWEDDEQRLREDIARARKRVESRGGVKRKSKRVQPNYFMLNEVEHKDVPEVRWPVPDFLAQGLAMYAGPPKAGKSWTMLDLVCQISIGGKIFGELPCKRGDCLWFNLEEDDAGLKERITEYLRGEPWPKRVTVSYTAPRIGEGLEEEIRAWVKRVKRPWLVVLDTFKHVRPRRDRDNSYETDSEDLEVLRALASELGICILVCHHTRKAKADDPFDTVLGTTGMMAPVDSMFVLLRKRGSNDARLIGVGRRIRGEFDKKLLWTGRIFEICGDNETENEEAKAELFLREMLARGPMKAKEIEKLAAGTHAERTLRRAREKICARPFKKDGVSYWKLK
jgi:hypothetical protein